ncbi:MAG: hypothetical protein ACRYG8_53930 [Janthinobacterium lividum]
MSDNPTNDPILEKTDETKTESCKPLLVRLREALPIAWKHDELFRYALILSILAWLVILFHVGSGTTRYR